MLLLCLRSLEYSFLLRASMTLSSYEQSNLNIVDFIQDLPDKLNYGLYLAPNRGRAGKFLSEERLLGDYALAGPVAALEFRYKRRIYAAPASEMKPAESKALDKLHSKGGIKKFVSHVKKGEVGRVAELLLKGLDPNLHDEDSGATVSSPTTILFVESTGGPTVVAVSVYLCLGLIGVFLRLLKCGPYGH